MGGGVEVEGGLGGGRWGGGVYMQHPIDDGRLRLALLNMERGHTAKKKKRLLGVSDWLLMLLSGPGLVEATRAPTSRCRD